MPSFNAFIKMIFLSFGVILVVTLY